MPNTVGLPASSVVSRHQNVTIEVAQTMEKPVEFHRPVALDTGVRGQTRRVVVNKAVDDSIPEIIDVVEDVVRNLQFGRDTTGIFCVRDRAAPGGGCFPTGA